MAALVDVTEGQLRRFNLCCPFYLHDMVTSVSACSMGVVLYYWLVMRWCCPDLDPIAACLLVVALLSRSSLVGGRDS